MQRFSQLSLASLALATGLGGLAWADTVTLRDRTQVSGKILAESPEALEVETASGKRSIARKDVLAIVRDAAPAGGAGTDGLPEATRLEREGLALESRGKYEDALARFEAALDAAVAVAPKGADGARERDARVEFLVRRLAFFWSKLSRHETAAKRLSSLLAGGKIGPYAQDVARFELSVRLAALGRTAEADAEIDRLGCATAFAIVGPFDNERGTGFGTAYDPETAPIDLGASYKGKKRAVSWRRTPIARPESGEIDLHALLRPSEQGLAYALTYLKVEKPTTVALRLGSDESLKVWVDRALVASEDRRRPLRFDQTHVAVTLAAGWHQVLLKVGNQSSAWGFRLRVTAPEGGAPAGVRWATHDEIAKAAAPAAATKESLAAGPAGGHAIEWLEARRKADPQDARARFRLGYLYYSLKPFDEGDHLDREAYDEARRLDPEDAHYQVFYSHTAAANAEFSVNREENKRRQALERALELDPGHSVAAYLLATYYQQSLGNRTRALELTRQALAQNPDYLDAELLRIGLESSQGLASLAAKRLRELAATPAAKTYAPLVRALAQDASAHGNETAHRAHQAVLAALEPGSLETRRQRAASLAVEGKLAEAIKVLQEASALDAYELGIRSEIARAQERVGDLASAEATYRAALEIAPEDEGLLQALGHLIERRDRATEARQIFDRCLVLNPNLVELKKYLDWLDRGKTGVAAFEDDWTLDARPIVEAAKSVPVDPQLASRLLLKNTITKVNPDGTSSTFVQEIERAENEEGLKELQEKGVGFHAGEQRLLFKRARLYRKTGEVEDVATGEAAGGGGGEFARYSGHSVRFDSLEVGDVTEVTWRIDDVQQGFFGDYFGVDEKFADFRKPIDHMRFVVLAPKEKTLHVHQTGLDDVKPVEKIDAKTGIVSRVWEKKAIARIEPEPNMPWAKEILPKVQVSTFGDWNTFAKWYWGLVRKQHESDDSIKQKVAELTKDCKTDEEKIRKIYNFVVTDIRYNAAWEFGVHGFKPYNATSIFARKFGDCKDKSTLINTMLGVCNIESYPVLIFGENPRGDEDLKLPLMHHFNHCISYVPGAKGGKGMWLDGTAQYHPFDTLPTMDYGATTLVVFPDKGELKTIPFRDAAANFEKEHHTVAMKADGGATVKSIFEGTGDFNHYFRAALATKGRRAEVLEQAIGKHYSGAKVKSVTTSDLDDLDKPVRVEVEVGLPKAFQKSTGGFAVEEIRSWLFDRVYLGGQKISGFAAKDARDFDVVLEVPSGVEEETVYELPAGFDVKSLPAETKLDSGFGSYVRTYKVEKGKLRVTRRLELKSNRIPKASYEEFRRFVGTIERSEAERVILTKEGGEE